MTFPYSRISPSFLNSPLLWSGCGYSLILLVASSCSTQIKNTAPCVVNNPVHTVWDQTRLRWIPVLFQKEFNSSRSPHNCMLKINPSSAFSCKLKQFLVSVSWKCSFGVSVAHMPQARKGLADKYFYHACKQMLALKFQKRTE